MVGVRATEFRRGVEVSKSRTLLRIEIGKSAGIESVSDADATR